jgi:hypothetical protein
VDAIRDEAEKALARKIVREAKSHERAARESDLSAGGEMRTDLTDPIANSKKELKKLGKLGPDEQRLAALAIKAGEAKTVAEAVTPDDEMQDRKEQGRQKMDPRLFQRLESKLGACNRDIDALHKAVPGAKFHRDAIAGVNAAIQAIHDWQKATR